jgi:hypothetical protein
LLDPRMSPVISATVERPQVDYERKPHESAPRSERMVA